MAAPGARSFEEEKRIIIKALSLIKPDDPQRAGKAGELLAAFLTGASPAALRDEELALVCVGVDVRSLRYFHPELRGRRSIILTAVNNEGGMLLEASKELRGDKEVVLAAVKNRGQVLEHASKELRGDREVVLAAVQDDAMALEHASEELQGDKEVVLAGMSNDGDALQYATEELRGDKEVVLAAVSNYRFALGYASEGLKDDKAFLLLAARSGNHLDPKNCYNEAGPSAKEALSEEEFCLAVESKLAIPGQSEPSPALLVTLTSTATDHTESGGDACFSVQAVLGLSGEKIIFDLPAGNRPNGPLVNDLAKELVAQLQEAGKMDEQQKHIFINFANGDVPVAVAPWDGQRPLSQFLPAQL